MRVVAVIPAFNEEASIVRVVQATAPHVDAVVVVDDGSRDRTAQVAREAGAHALVQPQNAGKGAALEAGFDYAMQNGFDVVVALDADGQHDPIYIPDLRAPIESGEADMAVGSRKRNWTGSMPLVRRLTNSFMSWMLGLVAGQPMEDTQSGYRAIHVRVLKDVKVSARHFEAESEFLLTAARKRFRIAWVPISVIYGVRPSHIRPVRDTIRFFKMLFRVLART
jgi:glycosyltransferase involved in cell wall biosynthesis